MLAGTVLCTHRVPLPKRMSVTAGTLKIPPSTATCTLAASARPGPNAANVESVRADKAEVLMGFTFNFG
jgi:hypothetical protein